MGEEAPKPRRKRQEWEAWFVSEFMSKQFPDAKKLLHVRMGSYPPDIKAMAETEEELRLLRVYLRWADAVAVTDDTVYIIEGKLRPAEYPKALAELELYLKLAPATPEISELLKTHKLRGILVCPIEDPIIASMARERGLQYIVFKPSFWDRYLSSLPWRSRRPSKVGP